MAPATSDSFYQTHQTHANTARHPNTGYGLPFGGHQEQFHSTQAQIYDSEMNLSNRNLAAYPGDYHRQ